MGTVSDEAALTPLTVRLSPGMMSELRAKAAIDGLSPEEMIANLFVIAFRTKDLRPPFPYFTLPNDCAAAFVEDGFRVLARDMDSCTLAPYDGVTFQDAVDSFQSAGLSEAEILEVVRS